MEQWTITRLKQVLWGHATFAVVFLSQLATRSDLGGKPFQLLKDGKHGAVEVWLLSIYTFCLTLPALEWAVVFLAFVIPIAGVYALSPDKAALTHRFLVGVGVIHILTVLGLAFILWSMLPFACMVFILGMGYAWWRVFRV